MRETRTRGAPHPPTVQALLRYCFLRSNSVLRVKYFARLFPRSSPKVSDFPKALY